MYYLDREDESLDFGVQMQPDYHKEKTNLKNKIIIFSPTYWTTTLLEKTAVFWAASACSGEIKSFSRLI